ncbi:hypothetical protein F5050DRAFT_1708129 [Lentinula boryana]|uniref:Uncharacterized protein n=1 Tax=Lentinula boryana TaxID=40481 RepID=A0ABQ8QT51_9AGAR|nr:hypothetical protein F5050DRAFT_1708129 [Lentinula boryana]
MANLTNSFLPSRTPQAQLLKSDQRQGSQPYLGVANWPPAEKILLRWKLTLALAIERSNSKQKSGSRLKTELIKEKNQEHDISYRSFGPTSKGGKLKSELNILRSNDIRIEAEFPTSLLAKEPCGRHAHKSPRSGETKYVLAGGYTYVDFRETFEPPPVRLLGIDGTYQLITGKSEVDKGQFNLGMNVQEVIIWKLSYLRGIQHSLTSQQT